MAAPLHQQMHDLSNELAGVLAVRMRGVSTELINAADGISASTSMLARIRALQRLANELAWVQADLAAAHKNEDSAEISRLEQRSTTLVTGLSSLVDDLKNA